MEMDFWKKLPMPFFCLAPMANVTDAAFRKIIAKYGKPDVMWTEFVSAHGLLSRGKEKLLADLKFSDSERPIVAQLFAGDPEKMHSAAKIIKEMKFDGLDINMGCPDKAIEKSGAGASLIKNPGLAREIIRAAKEGAYPVPVSVKTRLGYNKDILDEWLPEILAERPSAITVHARTRKEMSKVPAKWERVGRAVEIRNILAKSLKFTTLIIGNGDVLDINDAKMKAKESGADGVMMGRAIFGNPCLFADSRESANRCLEDRIRILVEHAKLFEKMLGGLKNFDIMKKHFKAYVSGFEGAKELRAKLMDADDYEDVKKIIDEYLLRKMPKLKNNS